MIEKTPTSEIFLRILIIIAFGILVSLITYDRFFKKGCLYLETIPESAHISTLKYNSLPINQINNEYKEGMELIPGEYCLTIEADGYYKKNEKIKIIPGEKSKYVFSLLPIYKTLHIAANPSDAYIVIVGSKQDYVDNIKLKAGNYEVRARASGYKEKIIQIIIKPEDEPYLSFEVTLEKEISVQSFYNALRTVDPKGNLVLRARRDNNSETLVYVCLSDLWFDLSCIQRERILENIKSRWRSEGGSTVIFYDATNTIQLASPKLFGGWDLKGCN